ncbi:Protein accelerated cell death 6 [Vitis vinifera]|uniref:Protein accelerated cell death 6 n=1 Tax=Vitis vinifera TaxID=29760 RepID=A0A438KFJ5_VITVI|nr:Protein accelerated cell death 6 [Vitis vinifera]
MRQDDLMMNFERLRKQGRGERWKTGKQRQKQPKKQAILAISELKDAKLLEDYVTASSMDPDLYRATIQGDILEFIKAVEQGPDNRHAGVPAASCIQVTPQKNTVLHLATIFGHDEIVKLISKDLPFLVMERNCRGDTALHIAARAGNSLLVNLLINSTEGVLGVKNETGNTALHEALQHRHEEVAWNIINKDRNMYCSVNKEGKSLLYLAAEAGYANLVRFIMENPAGNYSIEGKLENKPSVKAAILGKNTDVLKIMWERDQSSFNLRCEEGRNPLHYAASIGFVEGINYFLDKYCIAAYQGDKDGLSPIHIAAIKGHFHIIQEMLQHRPDLMELLTCKARIPFMSHEYGKGITLGHHYWCTLPRLDVRGWDSPINKELGADSNKEEGGEGQMAPHMPFSADVDMDRDRSAPYRYKHIVPAISADRSAPSTHVGMARDRSGPSTHVGMARDRSAPSTHVGMARDRKILSQVSPRNNTCLHIAVRFGHHELAEYIVKECPDLIKKTNSTGDTALHIAARKKDLSFVKFAMDSCPSGSGASRDVEKAEHPLLIIVNKEGNTVLHEALINRCKQEEVVEILIKADPQVAHYPNKEGKSLLFLAAEAHYFHVVEAIGKPKVEKHMNINRDREAKPAVHGAILGKNKGVQTLLAKDQSNFDRYHRDDEGFLPIHVASMRGYVDIVKELLQVSSDSIELLSKHGENILHVAAKYGQTAFDIAVSVEHPTSLHQRLIWTALKSTGARRAGNSKVPPKLPKSPNTDQYKDRVNTLLLVSTLVATVTFAAGFTMPGGYNSSDPSAGMAIFLMRNMFHMFVICNTIAIFALPLLGLALYAMSFGFMAGVSLVVSNLHWLAIVVFIIGIICLFSLSVPFLLLFLPSKSTNRILRYISYYPFLILVWASESPEIKQED